MKKENLTRGSDDEIERLRAMFAGVNQSAPPKGIRKFFHNLAERFATPQKKLIMKRVRDAEPVKKDAA